MSKSPKKKEDVNNRKKRPYRFALVGATASGKTCILAQLALNKDSGDRYSSGLASWDREKLSERDEKLADTDQGARLKRNYQQGLEMLRTAMKSIQSGEAPAPTPPGMNVRLMVDFEMGDSERGTFYVATEDYSGENINASEDALGNHETESYNLSQRLSKYDGLIFVVDTFLQGEDTQKSRSMVQGINAFFATVKNNPNVDLENLPVALIFSKWDKNGPIDFLNPDTESQRLDEYQKQEFVRFYNGIIKSVRNTVEEQERTGDDENYRVFPVSAFGKTRLENGNYAPELGAEAFGIVAPFVWMADRCDELNMASIRKQVENLPQGKWKWLNFNSRPAHDVVNRATFLQNRVSKKKNYGSELKEIQKTAQSVRRHAISNKILSGTLCVLVLLGGLQTFAFYQWNSVLKDPSATISDLNFVKSQVDWCSRFTASVPWVNRPYSKLLDKIQSQMEELVWLPVEKAPAGSREQMENARTYLKVYASGVHREEAEKIVAEYRQLLDEEVWKSVKAATSENDKAAQAKYYLDMVMKNEIPGEHKAEALKIVGVEYLAHLDDEAWKLVESTQDIPEKVVRAEQYLKRVEKEKLPGNHKSEAMHIINEVGPNYQDDQAWKRVEDASDPTSKKTAAEEYLEKLPAGRHANQAKDVIQNIESEMAWQEDKKSYDAAQDMSDKEERVKELVRGYNKSRWEPVVSAFPGTLELLLDRANASSDEVQKIGNCAQAIEILKNVEDFVRDKGSSATSTFAASQGKLRSKRQEIIHQYDRVLYEKVPNSLQACKDYLEKLNDYGGGTMVSDVEKMKQYFESLSSSCSFSCSGNTVTWGKAITNHEARVDIYINGSLVRSTPVDHDDGKQENLNDFNFSAIPNESVEIEIKVISDRNMGTMLGMGWSNGKELHSGKKSMSLRDWGNAGSVTIDIETGSSVILRLKNYPSKPYLNSWREYK